MAQKQERVVLADTTHARLLSLKRRLAEIEEDTPEAFRERKQLVGLLVKPTSLGKRQEDGRAEIQITYRFGLPPADLPASEGESAEDLSMPAFKNGRASSTPDINIPTLTVVAIR